jgi:hypothetical protein
MPEPHAGEQTARAERGTDELTSIHTRSRGDRSLRVFLA